MISSDIWKKNIATNQCKIYGEKYAFFMLVLTGDIEPLIPFIVYKCMEITDTQATKEDYELKCTLLSDVRWDPFLSSQTKNQRTAHTVISASTETYFTAHL